MPQRRTQYQAYEKPKVEKPYLGEYSALAEQLARRRHNPVQSVGQGVADLAGDLTAAYFQKKGMDKDKAAELEKNRKLADAFSVAQGGPFGLSPQANAKMAFQSMVQDDPEAAIANVDKFSEIAKLFGPQQKPAFSGTLSPGQRAYMDGQEVAAAPPNPSNELSFEQRMQLAQAQRPFAPQFSQATIMGPDNKPIVVPVDQRTGKAGEPIGISAADRPKNSNMIDIKTGAPLRMDPISNSYLDNDGAVVDPGYVIPAADFQKSVDESSKKLKAVNMAQTLMDDIEADPEAFSVGNRYEAGAKGIVSKNWAANVYTPEQGALRARAFRDAAMVVNELYGAALSQIESGRADQFVIMETDDAPTIAKKLKGAIDYANSELGNVPPSAVAKAKKLLEGVKQGRRATDDPDIDAILNKHGVE